MLGATAQTAAGGRLRDAEARVRETPAEVILELRLALSCGGELQVCASEARARVEDGMLTVLVPKAHPTGTAIEGFHPEVPPI